MTKAPIGRLDDLARLRSAPDLDRAEIRVLHRELSTAMAMFNWFTVGVMAPSASEALEALRSLERDQNGMRWRSFRAQNNRVRFI